MDLGAYAQIKDLESYLTKYKIEVPRLRGLRLMKEQHKVSQKNIKEFYEDDILNTLEWLFSQPMNFANSIWSSSKDRVKHKGLIYDENKKVIGYDLTQVHGKLKKKAKLLIKQCKRSYQEQFKLFNSMVGKDVLYVHARIGGGNWNWCNGIELTRHPRYLAHIYDSSDSTYCDLYFNIKED